MVYHGQAPTNGCTNVFVALTFDKPMTINQFQNERITHYNRTSRLGLGK